MKSVLCLVCLLALCACARPPEPSPEYVEPRCLPQYEDVFVLFEEFQRFRTGEDFLRQGFTAGSAYADWLQRVSLLEKKPELAKRARLLAVWAVAWLREGADSQVTSQLGIRLEAGLKGETEDLSMDGNPTSQLGGKGVVGIAFTGDTQGALAPQKVKKGDVGGIPRRTSLVNAIRGGYPDLLALDAGDALSSGSPGAENNNRALIMSMNAMGYHAMGLGLHDLRVGEGQLRELAGLATFPLVCSNLEQSGQAWPWLRPYVLLQRGGVSVAVLGLADGAGQAVAPGVRILQAREALARVLPEARAVSDCVVLLTQLGRAEVAAALAGQDGVDVVLGDGKETVDGRGWYLPTVPKGAGVGVVRLQRSGQGPISPASWVSIPLTSHASVAHALKILEEGGLQEKVLAF